MRGGKGYLLFQRRSVFFLLLLAVAAIIVAVISLALLIATRPPGNDSPEAGFARDMMVYHAQAVEMAEIMRDKTESEEIRFMATDIALTQQAQIGMMQGWLSTWGLPVVSTEPPMAWMDHPVEGLMPGMATPDEMDRLREASPEEADVLFLRLMIDHHKAAIPMAEAVLERTDRPEVRQLAEAIANSQQLEIQLMQEMLRERGAQPVEGQPTVPHEGHEGHGSGEVSLTRQELMTGITHGATLAATVFLAGIAAFVALVWLPASRAFRIERNGVVSFSHLMWALFVLLVIAGMVEISLYAVRASGEPFTPKLFGQALFDTRVGQVWLARLGFAFIMVLVGTWALREGKPSYWWVAAGLGSVLLLSLTQLSHAAAEGSFLPFLADWLHVIAASLWMGGLLGFPTLLLGPLRAMESDTRAKLLVRTVRRFSKMATIAVTILLVTGIYAILLHVPSLADLIGTPYGRALIMKLGLVAFVLAMGAMNLIGRGQGPFGRRVGAEFLLALGVFVATGFLTSLPPP
jgi:uncharacterized protein (DUF305 family)/putative copper export protein